MEVRRRDAQGRGTPGTNRMSASQQEAANKAKNQILLVTAGYDHSVKFWDVNSGLPSMQITIDSPAT